MAQKKPIHSQLAAKFAANLINNITPQDIATALRNFNYQNGVPSWIPGVTEIRPDELEKLRKIFGNCLSDAIVAGDVEMTQRAYLTLRDCLGVEIENLRLPISSPGSNLVM